ncbi:efflux RND transporter periplasmic adaptor subunit [Sulfuricurvum sp.]|uniref:efflux RND transporter periplasmic adaptor subunit n=1 Tax=Sulfuricurvum sp. TaxID=2025608 RepID=UPI00262F992A|nr:efflux RND transporter periplasmic adaptor subunit [Sulfuricurvum sp.]MDD2782201.1 efflux RND transporter periplasmic adaptor subunit [Sulfuricurvum sp.]
MKKSLLGLMLATAAMAQITISDAQMKKLGITTGTVSISSTALIGPLIAKIDYDEDKSKSYFLDQEASVVSLNVRQGDRVQKGQTLCSISSPALIASYFELKDLRNRYRAIQNNAAKDALLYKEGVISYRDYQASELEASSLHSRISTLESQFSIAGVRVEKNGTLNVIAQKRGVITDAPLAVAERILPYQPYFRISDSQAMVAMINVTPNLISSISKGDTVLSKDNSHPIGTIISVSPSISGSTNSAIAIARVRDPQLRAGTTVGMFISASKPTASILIPSQALTQFGGKTICFIRNTKGFKAQQLLISATTKEGVLVRQKGIDANTKVAISGLVILKGAMSGLGFE